MGVAASSLLRGSGVLQRFVPSLSNPPCVLRHADCFPLFVLTVLWLLTVHAGFSPLPLPHSHGLVLFLQMPHSRRYRSSERSSRGSYHERYRSRKHKRRRTRSRSSSSERDRRHRREDSYHVRSRR